MAEKEYQCAECNEIFYVKKGETPICPECYSRDVHPTPQVPITNW